MSVFLNEINNKNLFCYGAGKVFEDFLNSHPDIKIVAVIDKNYRNGCIEVGNQRIPVISVETFLKEADNAILLITCFDYSEVEKELGSYTELEKLPFYVYCQMNAESHFDFTSSSGKYQITEFRMQDYNAGHKAPSDVATIAADNGYKILSIVRGTVRYGQRQTEAEWLKACEEIADNAVVLVQFPIVDISGGIYRLNELKDKKHINIICVVHDIEILRRNVRDDYIEQYNMLQTLADIWIVHNTKMKEFLVSKGFPEDKIVSLEIFDYLIGDSPEVKKDSGVIVAGNLDIGKSEYIYHLSEIGDVKFNLFGANYSDNDHYDNISYFGTFLPDELIKNLQGKYGLVWDGNSLDTCSGLTGEYLKINNPHKLSLYLAIGLPVIIWDEAAEADFVLKEHVGITVKSLYELSDKLSKVSDSDYENMKHNAQIVGARLRNGEYMTKAIKKAEEKIQEIRKNRILQ
jgi:hypothetical protein